MCGGGHCFGEGLLSVWESQNVLASLIFHIVVQQWFAFTIATWSWNSRRRMSFVSQNDVSNISIDASFIVGVKWQGHILSWVTVHWRDLQAWRKVLLTSKENICYMAMRWKPRCTGGCKKSPDFFAVGTEQIVYCWTNVSISLKIMWRNKGFVC